MKLEEFIEKITELYKTIVEDPKIDLISWDYDFMLYVAGTSSAAIPKYIFDKDRIAYKHLKVLAVVIDVRDLFSEWHLKILEYPKVDPFIKRRLSMASQEILDAALKDLWKIYKACKERKEMRL